jgi:hypothetical protein
MGPNQPELPGVRHRRAQWRPLDIVPLRLTRGTFSFTTYSLIRVRCSGAIRRLRLEQMLGWKAQLPSRWRQRA